MTTHALIDRFDRQIDYVRLSVTDRCDFRCVYCMAEDMTFLPRNQILSLEQLFDAKGMVTCVTSNPTQKRVVLTR